MNMCYDVAYNFMTVRCSYNGLWDMVAKGAFCTYGY